jgi:CRP/FNR family cyclic AMP-dependent transcriptional regulator
VIGMTSLSVFDQLTMHHLVSDLPATWLRRLASAGRPVYLPAGRRLFREDGVADRFWLLHAGEVAIDFHVPGRGDIVVERIGPETVLGWSWSRPPYRWRFGAVVIEDVLAVEFDGPRVRALMADDAELGREIDARLLDVVAERLHAARLRLVELYAYPGATS